MTYKPFKMKGSPMHRNFGKGKAKRQQEKLFNLREKWVSHSHDAGAIFNNELSDDPTNIDHIKAYKKETRKENKAYKKFIKYKNKLDKNPLKKNPKLKDMPDAQRRAVFASGYKG